MQQISHSYCSNNTNKLSPQEPACSFKFNFFGSNNTNKLSPQELKYSYSVSLLVQIIQINLVLKNHVTKNECTLQFK